MINLKYIEIYFKSYYKYIKYKHYTLDSKKASALLRIASAKLFLGLRKAFEQSGEAFFVFHNFFITMDFYKNFTLETNSFQKA